MGLRRIAIEIKDLTYPEMMEMAGWFSVWTTNEDGTPLEITPEEMAAHLFDWAENAPGATGETE